MVLKCYEPFYCNKLYGFTNSFFIQKRNTKGPDQKVEKISREKITMHLEPVSIAMFRFFTSASLKSLINFACPIVCMFTLFYFNIVVFV